MKKYRSVFCILCVTLLFMACKSPPPPTPPVRPPARVPENAAEYFNQGNMHMGNLDYDLAIEEFTKAIRIDPNYYWAYLKRGNIYYYYQSPNKAIGDFTAVIRIKPDCAEAYFYRGIVHFNNNDFDKAIEDWKEVLNIDPERISAKRNIGVALLQKESLQSDLSIKNDYEEDDYEEVVTQEDNW